MSRQIQIRRGTAAEHDNFTGAIGEITMDTTNKTLRVHDGVTVGGNKLMLASDKPTINITNCITEIPQDIKFELNSGTLKLKSGSKIWIPNGKNAARSDENLGSNYWTNIYYTGTEYIALGKDAYLSWSQNGTTWSTATQDATMAAKQWRCIAYGNGVYVAIGTNGFISTSTDGHTWTAGKKNYSLDSNSWKALAFDGTKFVAIAQLGHISTSTNGTSWTAATQVANLTGGNDWGYILYDGTKFIALSNTGYISTSTDGTTWSAAAAVSNLGNHWWCGMAFNGSKYVAIAGQGWVSTSTDGENWTQAVQNSDLGSNGWNAITWDGTKFIVIGQYGAIASSVDGENWGDILYTQTTIQNDITVGTQSATGQTMVFYNYTTPGARADILTSSCIAGTSGSANSIVLNKNTNIIDYYNNSNVAEGSQYSFPLALVTVANGSVTSIDKVFNGFGFIDSIMFALPEIKYLIPNGRNDDGSPYSTESVVQTVLTCSLSGTNDKLPIVIGCNSITSDSLFEYDESNNTTPNNKVLVGYVDTVSGQITSFYTRPVFHLADYSDLKSIKDIVGITTESFSKSQSGYYKLDNGLIIQWVQVTNASQNGVYTLPTAFSSGTSYIAIPTFNNENEGGADPVQIWQQTSTTVSLHRYGGMSGNDIGIIAIGY